MLKEFDGLQYVCFEDGTCAVYECVDGRRSYDIPSRLPSGEIVTKIGRYAFYNCLNLTTINIPKDVTEIGNHAFYHCLNLVSINIPEGVTKIGEYAFYNCSDLRSINIPKSVTEIGDHAFWNCIKLIKSGFFKATNSNMCCKGFKYELEKIYETSEAKLCECGFHYCENAFDLFNYYAGKIGEEVRFFKVLPEEISKEREGDSKRVCKKITLIEEIKSYHDLLN